MVRLDPQPVDMASSTSNVTQTSSDGAKGSSTFSSFTFQQIGRLPSLLGRLQSPGLEDRRSPTPFLSTEVIDGNDISGALAETEASRPSLLDRIVLPTAQEADVDMLDARITAREAASSSDGPGQHHSVFHEDDYIPLPSPSQFVESPANDEIYSHIRRSQSPEEIIVDVRTPAPRFGSTPSELLYPQGTPKNETPSRSPSITATQCDTAHSILSPIPRQPTSAFIDVKAIQSVASSFLNNAPTLDSWCFAAPLSDLFREVENQQAEWEEVRNSRNETREEELRRWAREWQERDKQDDTVATQITSPNHEHSNRSRLVNGRSSVSTTVTGLTEVIHDPSNNAANPIVGTSLSSLEAFALGEAPLPEPRSVMTSGSLNVDQRLRGEHNAMDTPSERLHNDALITHPAPTDSRTIQPALSPRSIPKLSSVNLSRIASRSAASPNPTATQHVQAAHNTPPSLPHPPIKLEKESSCLTGQTEPDLAMARQDIDLKVHSASPQPASDLKRKRDTVTPVKMEIDANDVFPPTPVADVSHPKKRHKGIEADSQIKHEDIEVELPAQTVLPPLPADSPIPKTALPPFPADSNVYSAGATNLTPPGSISSLPSSPRPLRDPQHSSSSRSTTHERTSIARNDLSHLPVHPGPATEEPTPTVSTRSVVHRPASAQRSKSPPPDHAEVRKIPTRIVRRRRSGDHWSPPPPPVPSRPPSPPRGRPSVWSASHYSPQQPRRVSPSPPAMSWPIPSPDCVMGPRSPSPYPTFRPRSPSPVHNDRYHEAAEPYIPSRTPPYVDDRRSWRPPAADVLRPSPHRRPRSVHTPSPKGIAHPLPNVKGPAIPTTADGPQLQRLSWERPSAAPPLVARRPEPPKLSWERSEVPHAPINKTRAQQFSSEKNDTSQPEMTHRVERHRHLQVSDPPHTIERDVDFQGEIGRPGYIHAEGSSLLSRLGANPTGAASSGASHPPENQRIQFHESNSSDGITASEFAPQKHFPENGAMPAKVSLVDRIDLSPERTVQPHIQQRNVSRGHTRQAPRSRQASAPYPSHRHGHTTETNRTSHSSPTLVDRLSKDTYHKPTSLEDRIS
ncbi:hypothetical protein BD410DRAFT_895595 [Rickenella mellea]|uniref:Uncharacterized protein n=1 Tax=Rickenella mellea TaxID=50990 RepID=A0A4Y7QET2_9AGAM|nr:hypothetical protein BD410DRAFT_895595 [Rickenella mellea]